MGEVFLLMEINKEIEPQRKGTQETREAVVLKCVSGGGGSQGHMRFRAQVKMPI